jgi:hypothetical protein
MYVLAVVIVLLCSLCMNLVLAATCQIGKFSSDGQDPCSLCAAGYTTTTTGQTSCLACATGYYSATGSAYSPNSGCVGCNTGYSTPGPSTPGSDSSACSWCADGYYGIASSGTTGCASCPQGKYTSKGTGTTCNACNTGYTTSSIATSGTDASACTWCADGYSGSSSGGTSGCNMCSQGSYSLKGANPTCTSCTAGYTTQQAGTIGLDFSVCTQCDGGYVGTSNTNPTILAGCTICPQGKYSTEANGGTCIDCNEGYSTASNGTSGNSASACDRCASGFSGTPVTDTSTGIVSGCTKCTQGKYSMISIGITCNSCNTGYSTKTVGTKGNNYNINVCTVCAQGYSGSTTDGVTGCTLCPIGKYSIGPNTSCLSCSDGYTTSSTGTIGIDESVCNVCAIGYYSSNGNASSAKEGCTACDDGYTTVTSATSGINQSVCTKCAQGYYSSDGNASSTNTGCTSCNEGYSTPGSGTTGTSSSVCTQCNGGYYGTSSGGTSGCEICSIGKYSTSQNGGKCFKCEYGYTTEKDGTSGDSNSNACVEIPSSYIPSDYVKYGQFLGDYSYLIAQNTASYLDTLPSSILTMINPLPTNISEARTLSQLYAKSNDVGENTNYNNKNNRMKAKATIQYGISISFIPIIFLLLGILTLFLFDCCLCTRYCFQCCNIFLCEVNAKKRTKKDTSPLAIAAEQAIAKAELYGKIDERALRLRDKAENERVINSITKQRKRLTGLFIIFIFIGFIISISFIYLSNINFDNAYKNYDKTIDSIEISTKHWNTNIIGIKKEIINMEKSLKNAKINCWHTTLPTLDQYIDDLNKPLPNLDSLVLKFQGYISTGDSYNGNYIGVDGTSATSYRSYLIFILIALPFILFFFYIAMVLRHIEYKHNMNRWSMCCGQCTMLLYSIVALPMLTLTIVISDICINDDPMGFLSKQFIPINMQSSNSTQILTSCNNPLTPVIDNAMTGMSKMHIAVDSVLTGTADGNMVTCYNDPNLVKLNASTSAIYKPNGYLPTFISPTISTATSDKCPTFYTTINETIETNICGHTYNGIFFITCSIVTYSFITFFCLLILPVLKQHYNYMLKIWDASEFLNDDSDSEDELDPNDLLEKPGSGSGDGDNVELYHINEETKLENDNDDESKVSKITEFDWSNLESLNDENENPKLDTIAEEVGPYHNPNGKPKNGNSLEDYLDNVLADVENSSIKSVEDTIHFEALNQAGYEDDM